MVAKSLEEHTTKYGLGPEEVTVYIFLKKFLAKNIFSIFHVYIFS